MSKKPTGRPNGRPKGSKDKTKRITKKFITVEEERFISTNWTKYSLSEFSKMFNVSTAAINNIRKELNLDRKINLNNQIKICTNISETKDKTGIYAIITSDGKFYIGSSINIYKRLRRHINELNKLIHKNKSLQTSWNENFQIAILEECLECDLINRENYYIKNINNIHNTWKNSLFSKEELLYFKTKILKNILINENDCWVYKGHIERKTGYGRIKRIKDLKTKRGYTHRLMYFATHIDKDFNQIIRHKCTTKACCNPDHLEFGSYKDNNLDRMRNEMALFEKRFIETEYDYEKLMQEFKLNYIQVYSRSRHLGLFKKYPKFKKRRARQMSVDENMKNVAKSGPMPRAETQGEGRVLQ